MAPSKTYCPILGTLGYIIDGDKTLLIHRNARKTDEHLGKYNGLGGKIESNEDPATGMIREIKEEANIDVTSMHLRGVINWTGFGPNGEDWLGFIFMITAFDGTPKFKNEEGDLAWHNIADIDKLPMWEGDKYFLPLVFDKNPKIFYGYMPYANAKPIDWKVMRY